MFSIKELDLSDTNQQRGSTELELDLSDTNQQRGSTDSIQTTSGIAQIFQNLVNNKKGANVKQPGLFYVKVFRI